MGSGERKLSLEPSTWQIVVLTKDVVAMKIDVTENGPEECQKRARKWEKNAVTMVEIVHQMASLAMVNEGVKIRIRKFWFGFW